VTKNKGKESGPSIVEPCYFSFWLNTQDEPTNELKKQRERDDEERIMSIEKKLRQEGGDETKYAITSD